MCLAESLDVEQQAKKGGGLLQDAMGSSLERDGHDERDAVIQMLQQRLEDAMHYQVSPPPTMGLHLNLVLCTPMCRRV